MTGGCMKLFLITLFTKNLKLTAAFLNCVSQIFSTVFRDFEKKYSCETVFSTLDGTGNY